MNDVATTITIVGTLFGVSSVIVGWAAALINSRLKKMAHDIEKLQEADSDRKADVQALKATQTAFERQNERMEHKIDRMDAKIDKILENSSKNK